jgi:hypothetical protein
MRCRAYDTEVASRYLAEAAIPPQAVSARASRGRVANFTRDRQGFFGRIQAVGDDLGWRARSRR